MNHPNAPFQPPMDIDAVWQHSLIRVTDAFALPPIVLRVDDAIIGTLATSVYPRARRKLRRRSTSAPW